MHYKSSIIGMFDGTFKTISTRIDRAGILSYIR